MITQSSIRHDDEAEVGATSFPPLGEFVAAAFFLRLVLKSANSRFFFGI